MGNKKLLGVIIIGISGIILGFSTLLPHIYDLYSFYEGTYILGRRPVWQFFLGKTLSIIFLLGAVISSIYILKLKNWARKLFIGIMATDFIVGLAIIVIITKMLPYSKYGVLRRIGFFIVSFFSVFRFNYFSDFNFYFLSLPDTLFKYFSWSSFFLSIILPIIFIYYLTRPKVKIFYTSKKK